MKRVLLIVLGVLLITTPNYGQDYEAQIKELEIRKQKLEDSIKELQGSIDKIDLEITRLKSESFIDVASGNILILSVKKGAKLRSDYRRSAFIKVFEEDDKIVADTDFYELGYIKACFNNTCGYINTIWIKKTPMFEKFLEAAEAKQKLNRLNSVEAKNENAKTREDKMLKKYGKSVYDKLKQGRYWIGMNEEMARFSLGNPDDINASSGVWGTHEQWVYESGLYLYFENGKLTSYQD